MAFISVFVLLSFIFSSSPVSSNPISICEALQSNCHGRLIAEAEKFTVRYRQCLLEQLEDNYTDIWNMMPVAIETCLGREKFSKYLDMVQIGGPKLRELTKPAILPPSIDSSCTIVLVRGDPRRDSKSAEKQLINQFPQCDLHTVGMEPDESNPSGKFYDFNIFLLDGPKDGVRTEPIPLKKDGDNLTPYLAKVTSLLEKVIKVPRVDYLWIETVMKYYTWFKTPHEKWYIIPDPRNFPAYLILQEPINVTVCQVDMVTYFFLFQDGYDYMLLARPLFPALITSVISNSSLLPFRSHYNNNETGELHTFYFNISDSYCLKKYLAPVFCAEFQCPENFDMVIDTKVIFT